MNEAGLPGLGHNLPPLKERLAADYQSLIARANELGEAATRAPETIGDDETLGKVGDLVKLIAACIKAADAARVNEKEPFLVGGRQVDGFFKTVTDRLTATKRNLETRVGVYLRRKAEEERLRRHEEECLKREEAERLAAQARTETDLDRAVEAEQEALAAEKAADATPAELARTRSADLGSVSTLRTSWEFEVVDWDAVPLDVLRPYIARADIEKAIRAFVRAGHRELKGVRVFETQTAMVR